jgi:hypothetical protein
MVLQARVHVGWQFALRETPSLDPQSGGYSPSQQQVWRLRRRLLPSHAARTLRRLRGAQRRRGGLLLPEVDEQAARQLRAARSLCRPALRRARVARSLCRPAL